MLDRERILAKLDELDSYLGELRQVLPATFEEYARIEKKRASERLLQVSIEAVIDMCGLWVSGLRLGLPGEEDDLFEKLAEAGVLSANTAAKVREMKGLRNLLVHEYGRIDDKLVFELLRARLSDFAVFGEEIRRALQGGHG